MAKLRCTFTLSEEVVDNLTKIVKVMNTNKSAFIENILKETFEATKTLFDKENTLASSIVMLDKKLTEVQSMLSDKKNIVYYQNNIKEVKNEVKEALK